MQLSSSVKKSVVFNSNKHYNFENGLPPLRSAVPPCHLSPLCVKTNIKQYNMNYKTKFPWVLAGVWWAFFAFIYTYNFLSFFPALYGIGIMFINGKINWTHLLLSCIKLNTLPRATQENISFVLSWIILLNAEYRCSWYSGFLVLLLIFIQNIRCNCQNINLHPNIFIFQ